MVGSMCFKRFDWIETCHGIDGLFLSALVQRHNLCPGGGMVDTGDLKSLASNGVRVQVPPWALVVLSKISSFIDSALRYTYNPARLCLL